MQGRSQLGGRPGKKYPVSVLLTGVRSREVAMGLVGRLSARCHTKGCGAVMSLGRSRENVEDSGGNKRLKKVEKSQAKPQKEGCTRKSHVQECKLKLEKL